MRRTLYIASTLDNKHRVREIIGLFHSRGVDVTYDWTSHGRVFNNKELAEIGQKELQGVRDAAVVLLVTPAGLGSHFEAGAAYASGKSLIVLFEEPQDKPTSFYYLPGVEHCISIEHAIELVMEKLESYERSNPAEA